MLERLEEWVAKPGSPNLYWALTALPRPLVSLRKGNEQERLLAENVIPELAEVDAPRPPAAWSRYLDAMYSRMREVARRLSDNRFDHGVLARKLEMSLLADLASCKRDNLAAFRTSLVASGQHSEAQVQAMSDDEATARGVVLGYRTIWDETFKPVYLSYSEARQEQETGEKSIEAAESGPLALFALLQAGIGFLRASESRLDRRIALLRTVEAIRMYAAGHDGKLPDSLEAIHEAPILIDPVTGKAFSLTIEGEVATLVAPSVEHLYVMPEYKITIRKSNASANSPQ